MLVSLCPSALFVFSDFELSAVNPLCYNQWVPQAITTATVLLSMSRELMPVFKFYHSTARSELRVPESLHPSGTVGP